MSERSWIERLRDNYVNSDTAFDRLLPKELRHLSAVHWTPFDAPPRSILWGTRWAVWWGVITLRWAVAMAS